jgi:hypothetical protein
LDRNDEPRYLRLEAEADRLEARLASAEARAAQLEQARPIPGAGGAVGTGPTTLVVNINVTLNTIAAGSWGGSTVAIYDPVGALLGTGTTDAYGFCNYWLHIPDTWNGQPLTADVSHTGFTTLVITTPAVATGGCIGLFLADVLIFRQLS